MKSPLPMSVLFFITIFFLSCAGSRGTHTPRVGAVTCPDVDPSIGSTRYADGDINLRNECQWCGSGTSQTNWTSRAAIRIGSEVRITFDAGDSRSPSLVFTGSENGVA